MARDGAVLVRPRSHLSGTLAHFALGTLLTLLEMERRTGTLLLRAHRRTGRLDLSAGRVIHASAAICGIEHRGRDAVFELLDWTEGGFTFRVEEVSTLEDEVGTSTALLLLEAARRADELAA